MDPNFLKLFKISQLIIEYLLHSQDYLAEHRAALLRDVEDLETKLDVLTDTCEKQTLDSTALKRETRTLKKTLYAYQLMAKIPGACADPQTPVTTSYHVECLMFLLIVLLFFLFVFRVFCLFFVLLSFLATFEKAEKFTRDTFCYLLVF